jgi:HAD superfamily hydrolase (TIGR01509 family)
MSHTAQIPSPVELIIFDCDGVLIDSEWIACSVDAELLTANGYPISTEEVVRRFAGVSGDEMLAQIESELGYRLSPDLDQQIAERVVQRYRDELKPIAGAADTLALLQLPVCVASSSKPAKLTLGLTQAGLFERFHPHIFSTSLVRYGKPAPDIFLFAAAKMGKRPSGCVVVEDSIAGVKAARAAGMYAVGFSGGTHCPPGHAAHLLDAGAQIVIDRLDELPARLDLLQPAPA